MGSNGSRQKFKLKQFLWCIPSVILLLEIIWIPFSFDHHPEAAHIDLPHHHDFATTTDAARLLPSLHDLTKQPNDPTCITATAMEPIRNVELLPDGSGLDYISRRIPKIIHQTAKTRCVPSAFARISEKWKLDGHLYYFHDDGAMERLFQMDFPEFPHLKLVLENCVPNGTIKADLWRYLVLWLYGGLYADFDTAPNELNATTIADSDDGFFAVEQYHLLSQYFMAVSPRHPLMFYAIQRSLINLLQTTDTLQVAAAAKTGPHALHQAFQDFRYDVGYLVNPHVGDLKPVQAGFHEGSQNRSLRVVGIASNENQYVQRLAVSPGTRLRGYKMMGMRHFSTYTGPEAKRSGVTCMAAILHNSTLHL